MHRAKRFPGCDSVANLPMQNDSNCGVDRIFLLLAAAAENNAGSADCFTIHRRDITAAWAAYIIDMLRSGKPIRVVERADVSALQGHHLAKPLQALFRRRSSCSASSLPCATVSAAPPR